MNGAIEVLLSVTVVGLMTATFVRIAKRGPFLMKPRISVFHPPEAEPSLVELLSGPLEADARLYRRLRAQTRDVILAHQSQMSLLECRVTGLVLLKARRISDGIYSLSLGAMGQEAGALFRILQELWELLIFMDEDQSRIEGLLDKKPSAGKIAQQIGASFKDMREYLNQHASHVSISYPSMGHLLNVEDHTYRIDMKPGEHVLRTNVATLLSVLLMCAAAAVRILEAHAPEPAHALAGPLEEFRQDLMGHFRRVGLSDLERAI